MENTSKWKYFLIVICISNLIVAETPKHNKKEHKDDLNKKGLDLQDQLQRQFFVNAIKDVTKNAVSSPFSALLLLAALAKGAVGNSLKELEAGIGLKNEEIDGYFKQVFDGLNNKSLQISNKIYLQKNIQLKEDYRQAVQKTFKTTSDQVDFSKPKETVNLINEWVTKTTDGRISRMLAESDVNESDVMLLVNILDFVDTWEIIFNTTKDKFKTPKGEIIVDMMYSNGYHKYTYSSTLEAEIASIPYASGAEFYILLPNRRSSISKLLEAVADVDSIHDELSRMDPQNMHLRMPVFQVETKFDLAQIYKQLGVQQIFKPSAGLENMVMKSTSQPNLYVSKAIQKAFINVTSTGTTASAASAVGVKYVSGSSIPIPILFKVDRPFLFFVLAAKQQLYSGIVVDPSVK